LKFGGLAIPKKEIIKVIAVDKHVKIVEGSKVGVVIEKQKTPLKGDKVGGGCCKK
jgi:hypothetical protein